MEDLKKGLDEKGLIDFVKTVLLSGNEPRGKKALKNLKWGIKQFRKHLILHDVVQAKPEKANKDVLAIMATLVRTLSRLDNNNPDLLLKVDKKRLLKGKETLTEWCKIDPKDIPKPSSL